MLCILIFLLLITGYFTEELKCGPCPNITVDHFDVNQLHGEWYVYKCSCNARDDTIRCIKCKWNKLDEFGTATIFYKGFSKISGNIISFIYERIPKGQGTDVIHRLIPLLGNIKVEYLTLKTDYKTYSIVWACSNQGHMHSEKAWIFTRDLPPPSNLYQITRNTFARYGLDYPYFVDAGNDNCTEIFDLYKFN